MFEKELEEFETWLESEEGQKSIDLALERAEKIKEDLRKTRQISPERLNEPVTI